ncbi:MAG TPA: ATP-binding protein, partial [Myxococcaceae bacterium]
YGYEVDEIVGLPSTALAHPEDRALVAENLRRRLDGEVEEVRYQLRGFRKDGSVFPVEVHGRRIVLGGRVAVMGAVMDISDRKRAERRLLAQHEVTRALADARSLEDATPALLRAICQGLDWDVGGLWRLDADRKKLWVVDLWHSPTINAPRFVSATRTADFSRGSGLPGEVWASGAPVWLPDVVHSSSFVRAADAAAEGLHSALGFPILLAGEVLGVVDLFSREIRPPDPEVLELLRNLGSQIGQFIERKRAEQALEDARTQLAHLTRVMTMGELMAAIAHEVKQPLAALAAGASAGRRWLERQPPELDEARQCLQQIVADARRAAEVIDRIRALVEKSAPARARLDMNATIEDAMALARPEAQRHRVSIELALSPELPPVLGDRVQLQQVLLNLVLNAVHAMDGTAGPREVRVCSEPKDGTVRVAVEDRGPGLDPAALDRMFEPFFTTRPGGMGMGLAISRRIVEAHGGTLWASLRDGGGASFQFTLPAEAR